MELTTRVEAGVVSQFGNPQGIGGRAAGWVMAHRSSNRRRNRWIVEVLAPAPTDHVLEIGFGPGLAIEQLSQRLTRGKICGIDRSELMVRLATARNRAAIDQGRVELRVASVDDVPDFGTSFDVVLAVNSLMFWSKPTDALASLRGHLREGGRIAVAHQPRGRGAVQQQSERVAAELVGQLERAGYQDVMSKTLALRPAVVCAIGRAVAASPA
jgi:SAM-dependent methyltransferase